VIAKFKIFSRRSAVASAPQVRIVGPDGERLHAIAIDDVRFAREHVIAVAVCGW
jgi:hypothetical protein